MLPHQFEKEAINEAFELIKNTDFDADQKIFLRSFLEQQARDPLDSEEIEKTFRDKIKIIDALKNLHDFAKQYENEEKVFIPFQQKVQAILGFMWSA